MNSSTLSWVISSCRIILVKVGREQLPAKGAHKKNFPACELNLRLQNEPRERWFVHTVDGGNPAPVDMVNIPVFTGFHTMSTGAGFQPSTVVMVSYSNDLQQLITYTSRRMFTFHLQGKVLWQSYSVLYMQLVILSIPPFEMGAPSSCHIGPWVFVSWGLTPENDVPLGTPRGKLPASVGGRWCEILDWQRYGSNSSKDWHGKTRIDQWWNGMVKLLSVVIVIFFAWSVNSNNSRKNSGVLNKNPSSCCRIRNSAWF